MQTPSSSWQTSQIINSHCHITTQTTNQTTIQPNAQATGQTFIEQSREQNIGFSLMGGINPKDWTNQISLAREFPQELGLSFGLHPYFIAAAEDDEECESALNLLADQLSAALARKELPLLALGEAGLDFRPHIMKDSRERQIRFFENQVELALMLDLPLVLHVVQGFHEAMNVLDFFGPVPRGGLLHGFQGSLETAEQFIRRNFLISTGYGVTLEKNKKIQNTVKEMPLEWLVLETDDKDPAVLKEVALKIGSLRGISSEEILNVSSTNFKRVFGRSYGIGQSK